jgi:hypothetical protein
LTTVGIAVFGGASLDTAQLTPAAVKGKLVVLITDWSKGFGDATQLAAVTAVSRGAIGILLPINNDSLAGMMGLGRTIEPTTTLGPPRPASSRGAFFALVADRSIVAAIPEAAGQFAELRASPATVAAPVDGWQAALIQKMAVAKSVWVPNAVGILEGTDPVLKKEYLVISAHMDHVGGRCGGSTPADRICNGADDDASGTAGVVELAEAFAEARPKRSIIFLTVSGEEHGLWGSGHFAAKPPVEVQSMVANLNMDMIGRNWRDTVVAIGMQHSDLGATVERIAAENPDLGLKVVDDLWPQENLYARSDHYQFARRGVPVLFFTSGLHPDYHAVTDSPDKIDAEKEARILRLVFHLGQEVANAAARPKWNPESYRKIVPRGNQVP